jgi:hypothetical protein
MRESKNRPADLARRLKGTIVPRGSLQRFSPFGKAAKGLWPTDTAAELARRAGVTKRAAKYWLYGQRDPSALAVAVILNEITPRRGEA